MQETSDSRHDENGVLYESDEEGYESQHARHAQHAQRGVSPHQDDNHNLLNNEPGSLPFNRSDDSQNSVIAELDGMAEAGKGKRSPVFSPGCVPGNLPACFSSTPLVFDVSGFKPAYDSGKLVKDMNKHLNSASAPLERKLSPHAHMHGEKTTFMRQMHDPEEHSLDKNSHNVTQAQTDHICPRRHTSDASMHQQFMHPAKHMHTQHALREDDTNESPYGEIEIAGPAIDYVSRNTSQLYDEDEHMVSLPGDYRGHRASNQSHQGRLGQHEEHLSELYAEPVDASEYVYEGGRLKGVERDPRVPKGKGRRRKGSRAEHVSPGVDLFPGEMPPEDFSEGLKDLEEDVANYISREQHMHDQHAHDERAREQYNHQLQYRDEQYEEVREEEVGYDYVAQDIDEYNMHHPKLSQQRAEGYRGSAGVLQLEAEEEAERDSIRATTESLRREKRGKERSATLEKQVTQERFSTEQGEGLHEDVRAKGNEELWSSADAENRLADHQQTEKAEAHFRQQQQEQRIRREVALQERQAAISQQPPRPKAVMLQSDKAGSIGLPLVKSPVRGVSSVHVLPEPARPHAQQQERYEEEQGGVESQPEVGRRAYESMLHSQSDAEEAVVAQHAESQHAQYADEEGQCDNHHYNHNQQEPLSFGAMPPAECVSQKQHSIEDSLKSRSRSFKSRSLKSRSRPNTGHTDVSMDEKYATAESTPQASTPRDIETEEEGSAVHYTEEGQFSEHGHEGQEQHRGSEQQHRVPFDAGAASCVLQPREGASSVMNEQAALRDDSPTGESGVSPTGLCSYPIPAEV